jgi:RNA polymerase sigma factor (sigma-70 family)
MTPDCELLRRYAGTQSEEVFAELVRRHVNGDAHLAQDVAQTVFTDLARKAAPLSRRATLTGWLYTSAHFAAAKIVRTEHRRRDREEKFMREPISETAPELDWEKLRPTLDEAMHELKEAEREAILQRYFENRPFAEIGGQFGLNENAARMRVERALEKLRAVFLRRGVAASATLASVISANAVQIAPAGLAATLTSASLAGAGTGTLTLLKLMTMTKLKLGISALVIASAATTLVVQHQAQIKLREENQSLRQQMVQLQADNENFSNLATRAKSPPTLPDNQLNELLKLRGEVIRLRALASQADDPFVQTVLVWKAKEAKLRKLFEERPDQRIPEMQFLTDWQWLDMATHSDLDSEEGILSAFSLVRGNATSTFAYKIQQALGKYAEANNGNPLNSLSQLSPYFDPPVDDNILQRYQLLNKEDQARLDGAVVIEKSVVDKYREGLIRIGPTFTVTGPPEIHRYSFPQELKPALKSYQKENNGQFPNDFTELKPYVTTPEQEAALDKFIFTLKH